MLEYILILMLVLGAVFILARPVIGSLQKKITDSMKEGIFKDDPSGSAFYYYPLK